MVASLTAGATHGIMESWPLQNPHTACYLDTHINLRPFSLANSLLCPHLASSRTNSGFFFFLFFFLRGITNTTLSEFGHHLSSQSKVGLIYVSPITHKFSGQGWACTLAPSHLASPGCFLLISSLSDMASKTHGKGWGNCIRVTPHWYLSSTRKSLYDVFVLCLKRAEFSKSRVCVCSNRGHCGCSVLGRPQPPLCLQRSWKVGIRVEVNWF